ncbi:zinc-binding metallopeptidase [Segetibacter koreensis]|uniref:zinc-binding metallopeptidase n=1 Tax=Segetibacter koreensis TaxID=398037 RepID=UPI00037BDB0E|nr:putative zinc-binding metallopeptidase [Segetibacter koreensis]
MKILKFIFFTLSVSVVAISCKKEDALGNVDNIPGLGGDVWAKGPIDDWIYANLTTPYNIGVKYKWDQSEVDLDKTLVPPMEEKVIPVMSAIKEAWINTYVVEAGNLFFKKISPKFFILVGSPAYERGAVKLGTAEGGRKVVLYNINSFRIKGMPGYTVRDTSTVIDMFHVIEHEFSHILDQNVKVPIEFSAPSASSYTSDWLNVSKQDALDEGFITQYSISGKDDDWAEMVSMMLVHGKPWFDSLVNSINYTGTTANGITAEQAKARLRQKEASVVSYFKQAWNIDFYNLQAKTKGAIDQLLF